MQTQQHIYAVVARTMKMAQQIAEECGQDSIIDSYDLNIARMATQIQSEDRPQFDNILIFLGSFNNELAFFKALGKFIDGSDILEQADVLVSGSIFGFI